MKLSSGLALLLAAGAAASKHGIEEHHMNKASHGLRRHLESRRELSSGKLVSVIVEYEDEAGREQVEGLGHVTVSIPDIHAIGLDTTEDRLKEIMENPHIKNVEMDEMLHALAPVSGSLRGGRRQLAENELYGMTMTESDQFENAGGMKICVIDTGYDIDHNDLPGTDDGVTGYSPYNPDDDAGAGDQWHNDGHGHGTHCAGTIGAIGGNGFGVYGVNPDPSTFTFHIGKGLTDSGSGATSKVMNAVEDCVENGAKVISMSLGGGSYSQTFDNLYKLYNERDNVLIIAAAGNDGNSVKSYPASYPNVMSVGAVDRFENHAGFSQFNDQVEIAAPGVSIKSTTPGNNYATWSGTSMATPHVAGVAAKVWSHFPECSALQIRNVLVRSAVMPDDIADECNDQFGHGIVKAKAAYDMLDAGGCEAGDVEGVEEEGSIETPGGCAQGTFVPPPPPCDDAGVTIDESTCDGTVVTVTVKTDQWNGETTFDIKKGLSAVHRVCSFPGQFTEYVNQYCLGPGDYEFEIKDSWGDGICCTYGNGKYTVQVDGGATFTGGNFGSSAKHAFTIEGSEPDETSSPTASPTAAATETTTGATTGTTTGTTDSTTSHDNSFNTITST